MQDATLTSNLHNHMKLCWGEDIIKSAGEAGNVHAAHTILAKAQLQDSSIMAAFK